MTKNWTFYSLFVFLIFISTHLLAIHPPSPLDAIFGQEADARMEQMDQKTRKKFEKKRTKLKKKLNKLQKKVDKLKKKRRGNIWDNSKFSLGIMLLLAAIAIAILSILILPGFLGFIAGLVGVGGVVLVIWGLVEYAG